MLDDLDKELERRGHRFVRYADDFIISVKSQSAGERVMASVKRFIQRKLKLKVKAFDKYGLSAGNLYFGLEGKDERVEAKGFAPDLRGRKEAAVEYELDLGKFPLYSVVEYYATVSDNRNLAHLKLGPQTTESKRFRVTIQDPTKAAERKAQSFEQLRKRLMAAPSAAGSAGGTSRPVSPSWRVAAILWAMYSSRRSISSSYKASFFSVGCFWGTRCMTSRSRSSISSGRDSVPISIAPFWTSSSRS